MKQSILFSLMLALCTIPAATAHAQSGMKEQGTVHKGTGVVKGVDPVKGTITVAHEPIRSVNWSAMTMSFPVKDKALLEKAQPGKKIEFEFVQQGRDNVITSIK